MMWLMHVQPSIRITTDIYAIKKAPRDFVEFTQELARQTIHIVVQKYDYIILS